MTVTVTIPIAGAIEVSMEAGEEEEDDEIIERAMAVAAETMRSWDMEMTETGSSYAALVELELYEVIVEGNCLHAAYNEASVQR